MGPVSRFLLGVFTMVIAGSQTYPGMGGAQIQKPFQHAIRGAVCFTGTGPIAGNAFFYFPTQDRKALAFVIGPSGPNHGKAVPFAGPGTYSDISIFVKGESADEENLSGFGQVVVNEDGASGTFSFNSEAKAELQKPGQKKDRPPDQQKDKKKDDKEKSDKDDDEDSADDSSGAISGTWDCGRKLTYERLTADQR